MIVHKNEKFDTFDVSRILNIWNNLTQQLTFQIKICFSTSRCL